MKQIILILSFIIAAFLAACSDSVTTTELKQNGGGGQKTIEQLEKASTDESLEALKAQLELNKNLQISDIILTVKSKFGTSKKIEKEQPRKNGKKNSKRQVKVVEQAEVVVEENDEKVTERLLNLDFAETSSDASKVLESADGNTQKKVVCINTCKTQILIEKEYDSSKKLSDVRAFVVVSLDKENISHVSSDKDEKTLAAITAYYAARNSNMILEFGISNKDGKKLNPKSKPFVYDEGDFSGEFSQASTGTKGEYSVGVESDKKYLNLSFNNQEVLISHLVNDYGLFGSNIKKEDKGFDSKSKPGSDSAVKAKARM